jgi:Mg-chelatase subunit ChlD
MNRISEDERLRRWRLILGGGNCDGIGVKLSHVDGKRDQALGELYGGASGKTRRGGTEASMPNVSRWLGDVREYFPDSVVEIMQKDAIERVGLQRLLAEPEFLELVEPDVHLVATLIALNRVIPSGTRETARALVRKVVDDLLQKLTNPMRQAVSGALNRAARNRRPRHHEIDWNRTIRANLKHYQPEYRTIIPETLIGYGRKRQLAQRDVIVCIDQSGSMATSVVYASIFGAVMASIPALKTHLVVFDTAVVDLTAELHDPVDLLFGTQLGGGTDINQALGYCQQLVARPQETILILISDLYEGGNREDMLKHARQLKEAGVQFITLLALNDRGAPSYDRSIAAEFAGLDIASFACTPDLFPDLMAAAINRQDLAAWAAQHEINLPRAKDD